MSAVALPDSLDGKQLALDRQLVDALRCSLEEENSCAPEIPKNVEEHIQRDQDRKNGIEDVQSWKSSTTPTIRTAAQPSESSTRCQVATLAFMLSPP